MIHAPVILIIGFALFFGTIGARVFQWLRIPQVVGYIAIGVIVGKMGIGLVDDTVIDNLLPFNFLALGVIGFMIGGELQRDIFRKYGRQFFSVLVSEGIGAFIVVTLLIWLVVWVGTGDLLQATTLAIMLGAIASATAPAATVDVLWEYKARGSLTSTVFAIVALDDVLALVLFGLAASIASNIISTTAGSVIGFLGLTLYELAGAVLLGALMGYALNLALRRSRDHEKVLAFTIGAVTLVVGAAQALEFDLILAAMALGATTRNLAPRRSTNAFEMVRRFSPPIYVLFFVFVGARLDVRGIPPWMRAVAAAYLVGRTTGKLVGATLGARIGRASEVVRKYLGLTLFSQAGVAVGLAIMASVRFPGEIGDAIVTIITATTFVVQLIGPPCVKYAIHKAGEAGRDITEEDLMESMKVSEVMQGKAFTFMANTPLPQILLSIAETEAVAYPVVVQENELIGMITIQGLKQSFAIEGEKHWYLAYDLMEPVPDIVTGEMPIGEAVTKMRELYLDYMPVVETDEDRKLIGMLELREVSRQIAHELIMRRGEV